MAALAAISLFRNEAKVMGRAELPKLTIRDDIEGWRFLTRLGALGTRNLFHRLQTLSLLTKTPLEFPLTSGFSFASFPTDAATAYITFCILSLCSFPPLFLLQPDFQRVIAHALLSPWLRELGIALTWTTKKEAKERWDSPVTA